MRVPVRVAATLVTAITAVGVLAGTTGATVKPNVAASAAKSWQVIVPHWTHANKEEGRVDDIKRIGKHIFLAGDFTKMANHAGNTVTRNHVAALSPSGNLLPFHPNVNGRVYALASSPNGKYLYIGGQFSSVNGKPRHDLAAFIAKTGKLAPRIGDARISGQVRGLTATASGLYFGGTFSSVMGKKRAKVAKLVLRRHGKMTLAAWSPSVNGDVRDIVVDRRQGRVIFGGLFSSVNGKSQPYLAAVSRKAGKLSRWANHPSADILDIALGGRRIYAAEGGPGGTALAYNVNSGKQIWYYKTDGNCQAVTAIDGYSIFGMHGDNVAPKKNAAMSEYGGSKRIKRGKVFMLSHSGVLTKWNPDLSSTAGVLGVWSLTNGKGNVYVGGDFTGVHGKPQQRFAILKGLHTKHKKHKQAKH